MPSQQVQSPSNKQPMPFPRVQTIALNPIMGEDCWVNQIRDHIIHVHDEITLLSPVSIFRVPETQVATKPEDYIPQKIAMGPYHQRRPELYSMERLKISSARNTHERLKKIGSNLQKFVDDLQGFDLTIRSCYDRYLDNGKEALAWMMAVDASFLLEFLRDLADKGTTSEEMISSVISYFDSFSIKNSPKHLFIRDIMMLENQIPLFLLKEVLYAQYLERDEANEEFSRILTRFCEELTPFKKDKDFSDIDFTDYDHLLELLYFVLLRKFEEITILEGTTEEPSDTSGRVKRRARTICGCRKTRKPKPGQPAAGGAEPSAATSGHCMNFLKTIGRFLSKLNDGPIGHITKPLTVLSTLPWADIFNIPPFSYCKPVTHADSTEERNIPTASDLISAGVGFVAMEGGLSTIEFDSRIGRFYLPTITLDVNTEVILRNLVAFEASIASNYMVFTRYTELMDGIIDTEEDAEILRHSRIVSAPSFSDEEVANLWNGMRKSVKLVGSDFINDQITKASTYYNSSVKMKKAVKKCVFGWWQWLTFVAAILLLLLTAIEAFCSVYTCHRWFRNIKIGPAND